MSSADGQYTGETTRIDVEGYARERIPRMNAKSLAHAFTAILLGTASLALAIIPIARATSNIMVQAASGVSYVYGGVETDSIERLNSLAGGFEGKELVFALNSGELCKRCQGRHRRRGGQDGSGYHLGGPVVSGQGTGR